MAKWIVSMLMVLSVLFIQQAEAAKAYTLAVEPVIRVGLWEDQSNLIISGGADFGLRDADTNKILGKYNAKEKVLLTWDKGKILLNDRVVAAKKLCIVLLNDEPDKGVELNRKVYRGSIEIANVAGEGMQVINRLGLESYLYGIVAAEMPSSWHLEAVKAQAVAARTFALQNLNKHAAQGYDVCTTTHCQVYGGKGAESARAIQAVDDTRGLAMLYGNLPIHAVFHSSSGGRTENSEEIWGQYHPYLRSVEDEDQAAPFYHWEKRMLPKEIEEKLRLAGYKIGILQALELSPLKENGKNQTDRSAAGRIRKMSFIGSTGSVELTGMQARDLLGLKSSLFDVKLIVPEEDKIEVPIGWRYRKEINIELPPYEENKGLITDGVNIRRLHGRSGEIFVIEGAGWGHGLGMSQWGAKAMAEKQPETNTTYFKEILRYYYKGIEIKKVY